MPRYRLTIAYDGTDYCGWQKQEPPDPSAPAPTPDAPDERPRIVLPTVQHVVEQAVRAAVRENVILTGASRTDSGVHAGGQVAAFTTSDDRARGWPVDRGTEPLRRAINSKLPDDVVVHDVRAVPDDFDPIQHAERKAYSYRLHISRDRAMWDRRFVHHMWTDVDVGAMNAAAAVLVGERDFAGFAAMGHGRLTTVRTLFECKVVEDAPASAFPLTPGNLDISTPSRRIRIDVVGSGFLWNMVRIIAGTLADVGMGRSDAARVREALTTGNRTLAGPTLPARGLRLEWIKYRGEGDAPPTTAT